MFPAKFPVLGSVPGHGDHTACLWDVAEGAPKRIQVFSGHTRSVKTAVFRPREPDVFATGARDGHVLVWDARAAPQPAVVLKPDNCLLNCHSGFAPKAPGSHSKRPRLDTQRAVSITGLAFRDRDTLVSCGECDGNIKLWDLRKNYSVHRREPLPKRSIPYCGGSAKNGYTNLIVDDAGLRLYASCMDDVVYCFNVSAPGPLPERRYVGHENGTFYIKTGLSPDGNYLVSGSSDKNAYIWNVRCSEPVVKLVGHRAEVTCAAWARTPDLKLVTCSDDARHKIWRVGPDLLAGPDAARGGPDLEGRAEPAPRGRAPPPLQWGARDSTPGARKRPAPSPPPSAAKRHRDLAAGGRKTKRCLTDLMNAAKDDDRDGPAKRPRGEAAAGEPAAEEPGPAGDPPPKNYEKVAGEKLSPRSPKTISPKRSPPSPSRVRVVAFETPTENLPDFVRDGEAPHLRLMSPVKRKRGAPDWLTLIGREKRARGAEATAPGPREAPRPLSGAERSPRPAGTKSGTLLKYFKVTDESVGASGT
ncbi:unnamed protein product [Diatraea saccharalis]|uniref:Protein lethal(2)denticleless n=1 Tax=Diatraea saccharalis TaxID=40085 RepID=A0A9N9W8S1_9NEOP|nr:unnamed protein product [Diatraea saccharalis]